MLLEREVRGDVTARSDLTDRFLLVMLFGNFVTALRALQVIALDFRGLLHQERVLANRTGLVDRTIPASKITLGIIAAAVE